MPVISKRGRGRLLISMVACALLVSACAAGPDFIRPMAPLTQKYTAEGDNGLQGVQHIVRDQRPEADWWRAFRSSALDGVMAQALADNNSLAATRARLAAAWEEVDAVSGALWPQLSLTGVAGRQKYGVALFGPSNITIPPFTYYTAGPQVTYLLDVAGGEHRTVERQQALAEYQACRFDALRLRSGRAHV